MKYKVYNIPPNTRNWTKGYNPALIIDVDYSKAGSIDARLYTTATSFALPIPPLNGNINSLNSTNSAEGSALVFRTIPSGQNPTYGAYSTGLYIYGGYSAGAPDDWAGVILTVRMPVGVLKYAFTFGGKIYFMRHKTDGTVELAWTAV